MTQQKGSHMAYEDEKNRNIAIAIGVKAAVDLATANTTDDPKTTFLDHLDEIVGKVLEIHAVYAVQAAFPGTTVQTVASSPVEATTAAPESSFAPQAAAFVQAHDTQRVQVVSPDYTGPGVLVGGEVVNTPAAIPGVTDGDPQVAELWKDLASNPKGWFDNQFANKHGFQNPKTGEVVPGNMRKPSFKKKGEGEQPALWLNDKKNPSWYLQALAQAGIAVI